MQKRFWLALTALLISGCSSGVSENTETNSSQDPSTTQQEVLSDEEQMMDKTPTVVVYYSATGTTEKIATYIQEEADCDIFRIETAEPYSKADLDYTDSESRVSLEHELEDKAIDLVTTEVPDWDTYEVVYLGYPIWWGEAAFPMQSFVKDENFEGKTVIPFCTSASSDIGSSAQELAESVNYRGNWLDGGSFSSSSTIEDVRSWMEGYDLETFGGL